ncbi:hypothetical protein [Asticcacaulis taihuensis]|jgi:hypothetical protein|uniref:Uncharacterized protein n=1 Tax=Asticcacaulis taihuensis TaxID=260084 RepID=A0A1G4PV41_9CAUL|nr:hypothetical protein [Asticcacaulis taihuensis]SCW36065.1 hypothetical protein SAMN02927928_0682 [Asticcacaulis taihuensis]
MHKVIQDSAAFVDLGSATDATKGSTPGTRPDGTQPLQYFMDGLAAD